MLKRRDASTEASSKTAAVEGKGEALSDLDRHKEAIAVYDEVIARLAGATQLPLLEQVAAAFVGKGRALSGLGYNNEAIAVYDELIARLAGATQLPLLEQVAAAFVNKGRALSGLGYNNEAIAVYDELIARLAGATQLPLLEQVAAARVGKAKAHLENLIAKRRSPGPDGTTSDSEGTTGNGGRPATGRSTGGAADDGEDIRQDIEIDLIDAFSGTKATLKVAARRACTTCAASSLLANAKACAACHGSGLITREHTLLVAIPAGIEDGSRIRLAGKGNFIVGGKTGDLYIHVTIRPHPFFRRDRADIMMCYPLRKTSAASGDIIEVPLVDGSKAKLKLPPDTRTGDRFRLRGRGFTVLRSQLRGDMYVETVVADAVE